MELDYYLFKNKITQCAMAKKLDLMPQHLNRIVKRKATPNLPTAIKIYNFTDGQVTYEEMLKEEDRI